MFEKSKELNILDKTVKITCALNAASVAQIDEPVSYTHLDVYKRQGQDDRYLGYNG